MAGTVLDSATGQPVDRVAVYPLSGQRSETNADGRFALGGVDRSGAVLVFRRIGYAPRAIRLGQLAADARVELGSFTLTPLAFMLDSISVQAELIKHNPKLADFYERRRFGTGTFFTRDDIWKRNPIYITDLTRAVPNVSCSPGGCNSRRAAGLRRTCTMQVIVDGMPTDLSLDNIPPAWVAGIEVYRGIATTPIQYGGTGRGDRGPQCGTIMIWTGVDDQ